jgi:hypothetical protein
MLGFLCYLSLAWAQTDDSIPLVPLEHAALVGKSVFFFFFFSLSLSLTGRPNTAQRVLVDWLRALLHFRTRGLDVHPDAPTRHHHGTWLFKRQSGACHALHFRDYVQRQHSRGDRSILAADVPLVQSIALDRQFPKRSRQALALDAVRVHVYDSVCQRPEFCGSRGHPHA